MKVAITSTGNSQDAKLDSRFGRCSYFVIYNTENQAKEYIPNPHKDNIEGSGLASVQLIASLGVRKVVSGEFGAKIKSTFDSFQIQLIILKDPEKSIREIIGLLDH